jgi:glucose-6-phosphate isomerase
MDRNALFTYDIANCLADRIGALGIKLEDIYAFESALHKAQSQFTLWREASSHGFLDLPLKREYITGADHVLGELPDEVDTLLHLGIGGSSLGPIAIQQALDNALTRKLPTRIRRVIIQENVDPEGFAIRVGDIDWSRTAINAVSKSGGTIETLACLTAALQQMQQVLPPSEIGKRLIITTENMDGVLAGIGRELGAVMVPLPSNVGGRFSVLTPVGLLPARAMGINIGELMDGAETMRVQCLHAREADDPCFLSALIPWILSRRGVNIHVLFPYSDLLRGFALWCCQLLGESLGKRVDRDNNVIHTGMTPVPSVGSVDQHSLLQLYMEGPKDKFVTFFRVEEFRSDVPMGELPHPRLEPQHKIGLRMSDIINAEQRGTADALALAGRPSATIVLPTISANTLGQLFYFFELSTAYAAELFNIDAFDQPGVEASKQLTLKYLRGES